MRANGKPMGSNAATTLTKKTLMSFWRRLVQQYLDVKAKRFDFNCGAMWHTPCLKLSQSKLTFGIVAADITETSDHNLARRPSSHISGALRDCSALPPLWLRSGSALNPPTLLRLCSGSVPPRSVTRPSAGPGARSAPVERAKRAPPTPWAREARPSPKGFRGPMGSQALRAARPESSKEGRHKAATQHPES